MPTLWLRRFPGIKAELFFAFNLNNLAVVDNDLDGTDLQAV